MVKKVFLVFVGVVLVFVLIFGCVGFSYVGILLFEFCDNVCDNVLIEF